MKRYSIIHYPMSALLILAPLSSCSINRIAVNKTSQMISAGMPAIFSESDLAYARESIPPNLKLMEMLMETQRNGALLFNASMGLCGYAYAFLEDVDQKRATYFYRKGLAYSDELLEKHGLMQDGIMKKEKVTRDNAPWLFWNTFCKSGLVNINRDDPEILAMMADVKEQALRIIDVYPEYFYSSAYSILGSMEAVMPRALGGNPDKSREYFEKAASGGGDFLLNYLMYAGTYAVAAQDEKLFDKLLDKIAAAEKKKDEKAFFDAIAREKAVKLREKKNELF